MVDQLKPEHFLCYGLEKLEPFKHYEHKFSSTPIKPAYLLENLQPKSPKLVPLKVVEMKLPKITTKRQQQPICVPFIWETKPGIPKNDWKLVFEGEKNGNKNGKDFCDKNGSKDERETIFNPDFESFNFETNKSFVLETPPGYESDSSTSSYVTGTTSLVGEPFLERLFPLLSPKLSFLEKVGSIEEKEKRSKCFKINLENKDSVCERGFGVAMRRPMTLEELIMMSRRRSYLRKAVPIRRNKSMGSTKKKEIGCFTFGVNDMFEDLQRKMKRHLQLKVE